jgi:acyl-CoA reductase-like NAD-dependent aldehyde dehydrogenase
MKPLAEVEPHDWVREELGYVRAASQAVADQAYDHWRSTGGGEAYAIYRAAQDRADAAQDELALCVAAMARADADPDL